MPENTTTECVGDPSRNDHSPAATAEIAGMIEKLSISRSSNAEESDASSEDGGSDATRTVQSVERVQYNKSISTESSSSTVSNVSWTNEDRDQERELRSRSSSECSNSSSASSDSTPPKCDEENKDLEIRFDNLKIVQADDSQQKVAEISERDVDSNCERTTDDSDDESSAEENQESDDTESESDGEEFTQRGPMTSDSRRSPPYRSRPYDDTRNQNRNNIRQDIGDYYSQEPYNVPDSSVGVSTTGNDEVSQQVSNVMLDACLRTITADPKAALQICQLMEAADFEPDTQQGYIQPIRQSSPSIGSVSPVSTYSIETPSPENGYMYGPALEEDVTEIIGGMDNLRSPTSYPSVNADAEWDLPIFMDNSQDQLFPVLQSTNQLGRTPGTGVFNGGSMTVRTHLTTSMPEGQDRHTLYITDNSNGVELPPWPETRSLNDMSPRVPESVIPITVLDIDNTPADSTEYAGVMRSLDLRPTRSTDEFKRHVSWKSLRFNRIYLLDKKDDEFSARDDKGKTFAMILLSRPEDRILERLARLAFTLEKMRRVPESFMARTLDHNHDLLYMAAINFGIKYPFIAGLVLQKTFQALGEKSEIWTRTYDRARNTLLHVIIIKGQNYVNVLRELLDMRTTGDQAVFSVSATNAQGKTPWDLAVEADSQGSGNYTSITQLLENYRTPNVIGSNIVVNMAPNIPYTRQL